MAVIKVKRTPGARSFDDIMKNPVTAEEKKRAAKTAAMIKEAVKPILETVKPALESSLEPVKPILETVKPALESSLEPVKPILETVKPALESLLEPVKPILETVKPALESLLEPVKPILETVKQLVQVFESYNEWQKTSKKQRLDKTPIPERYEEGLQIGELIQKNQLTADCLNEPTLANLYTCIVVWWLKENGYLNGENPPFAWTDKVNIKALHSLHEGLLEKHSDPVNRLNHQHQLINRIFNSYCVFITCKDKTGKKLAERIFKNIARDREYWENKHKHLKDGGAWQAPKLPDDEIDDIAQFLSSFG